MSSIKTCLIYICAVLLLFSCKQEDPKKVLMETANNIKSLNSCEYIIITTINNTYLDNSSTSHEILAKNPEDSTKMDLITQDENNQLSYNIIDKDYSQNFLYLIADMINETLENKNPNIDTINIYKQSDTIVILTGTKANNIFIKYLFLIKDNLPTHLDISAKLPESLTYTSQQTFNIEYKSINNVSPSKIAELKSTIKVQEEKLNQQRLAAALIFENKYLRGNIGHIPIRMHLTRTVKADKNLINGSYYYTNKGIPIKLSGELSDDGSFILNESINNNKTGVFTGQFSLSGEISGIWSNPNGDKTFDFKLENGYEPLDIVWVNEKKTKNDATIELKIPQIDGTTHENQKINDGIASLLDGGNIEDHLNLINDMESGHFIETGANIYNNSNGILSMTVSSFTYQGGAHPNTHTVALNFEIESGEQISHEDLFVLNYEETLNKLAIDKFKKICNSKEYEDPDWYAWEIDRIPNYLKTNFIIGINGINFFFNRYDIGPYAAGFPPDILLSYDELEEIIDHNGILSQMLN